MSAILAKPKPEPYLPPKELADALEHQGIVGFDARACRQLLRVLRADGVAIVRRKYVRASDAAAWLVAHPDWTPYTTRKAAAGLFFLAGSAP